MSCKLNVACGVFVGLAAFQFAAWPGDWEPAYDTREFTFRYAVTVNQIPGHAERLAIWVPVPRSTAVQRVENVEVSGLDEFEFVQDDRFKNRYLLATLTRDHLSGDAVSFEIAVDVERRVRRGLCNHEGAERPDGTGLAHYLAASTLVKLDGPVAQEAKRVAGNETDPLAQAKLLYDHVVATVKYDKSGEGWGRGDSYYACDARAGNCTDFHSLFIGEARSLGIPARFLMGFSVPAGEKEGDIGGYHCWAEFFVAGYGWIPVDASEAHKQPERASFLFGNLEADRVQFTVGRDIRVPGVQTGPLNYSIYPHVEVDGVIHESVERSFSYQDR